MARQLVLDTETTGLDSRHGHRIIEIACVELLDRKITGNNFHVYINPERSIDAGALAIHGISNEFLSDKPLFKDIVTAFLAFITGAELIIHNASFDVAFINAEFALLTEPLTQITNYCHIVDTLQLAKTVHPGARNNLDALCKRYGINNTQRQYHGALLDAHLLAQVYLALSSAQKSFADHLIASSTALATAAHHSASVLTYDPGVIIAADDQELQAHEAYLTAMRAAGDCLWLAPD